MWNKIKELLKRVVWTPEKYARENGVIIGKNCWIATRNFGSEPYLIEIGNHVQITAGVKFFNHGGGWIYRDKYPDLDVFGKIKIGNNVYIGNNVLIMPGVVIGDNVIIGAGAVVTKTFESNVIIGGNPAKVIGDINKYEQKILPFNLKTKGMSYENKRQYLLSLDDSKFIKK